MGLGFKQVGDKVAVDVTLAAQLIEQGVRQADRAEADIEAARR